MKEIPLEKLPYTSVGGYSGPDTYWLEYAPAYWCELSTTSHPLRSNALVSLKDTDDASLYPDEFEIKAYLHGCWLCGWYNYEEEIPDPGLCDTCLVKMRSW